MTKIVNFQSIFLESRTNTVFYVLKTLVKSIFQNFIIYSFYGKYEVGKGVFSDHHSVTEFQPILKFDSSNSSENFPL